jgi:hypothetical protein
MERGSCRGAEAAGSARGIQASVAQLLGQCRGDQARCEAAGLDERKRGGGTDATRLAVRRRGQRGESETT